MNYPGGLTVDPVQGTEIVLHDLGKKMVAGKELTQAEKLVGITAVNQEHWMQSPNSPQNFTVSTIDLPPNVIGEIVNHAT